jgi:homoserine O-succinyltransferase
MIDIAIINNMPDAALRRTERQFTDLLDGASGAQPVRVRLHALPAVPRGEAGLAHVAAAYRPIDELWSHPPDALVVTGTEPRAGHLPDEPYWDALTGLVDWAAARRIPAMFSCLAAHAAVLHTDGIARLPLAEKCFGVFDHDVAADHPLMHGVGRAIKLPHTRWNRVDEAALTHAGYEVLSHAPEAGVGLFAREQDALWLFVQGHPEYDGPNLAREYRRDVQRFLLHERPSYPALPRNYFGHEETAALNAFRDIALTQRNIAAMDEFPEAMCAGRGCDTWREAAIRICANWLTAVIEARSPRKLRAMAL